MISRVGFFQVIRGILYFFGIPAILLLASGDIQWWQAWVYIGFSYLAVIISRILVARKNPDLLAERAESSKKQGTKPWDKLLLPLSALWIPILYFITAGLDRRWQWSPVIPLWITLTALIIGLAGFAFSTWAMVENKFFSAVVRIQQDRGHKVVESGPYRLVRHPGYAGGLLAALMFPLITNSLWAFIPVSLNIVVLIMRTDLEDKTLVAELPGYREYTEKTRYRLLPGVW